MAKSVLITRPGAKGRALCEALDAVGINCEYIPALTISENPHQYSQQSEKTKQELIHQLQSSVMIIVISANAVNYCEILRPEFTHDIPILAIGKATQQALINNKHYGEQQISMPKEYSAEGLLQLEILQKIQDKKIALICGVGGRALLEEVLIERGAVCFRIESYQRTYPIENEVKLQRQLVLSHVDRVVVTSGQALENLVKMSGGQLPALLKLQLVVISERIAHIAVDLAFQKPALIIKNADNAAIVKLLKKG